MILSVCNCTTASAVNRGQGRGVHVRPHAACPWGLVRYLVPVCAGGAWLETLFGWGAHFARLLWCMFELKDCAVLRWLDRLVMVGLMPFSLLLLPLLPLYVCNWLPNELRQMAMMTHSGQRTRTTMFTHSLRRTNSMPCACSWTPPCSFFSFETKK